MVTLITLVLNPVRPDSSVGRASGICPIDPGFNPQSGYLSVLIWLLARGCSSGEQTQMVDRPSRSSVHRKSMDTVAPAPMPQSSSRQTEPALSISVSISSGRPTKDTSRDTARGLSESTYTDMSCMQPHSQPDLTQVRINQNDSMEVNFLLNPNHPDGWSRLRALHSLTCLCRLYIDYRESTGSGVGVEWECTLGSCRWQVYIDYT